MNELTNVVSAWTHRVKNGEQPNSDDLLDVTRDLAKNYHILV